MLPLRPLFPHFLISITPTSKIIFRSLSYKMEPLRFRSSMTCRLCRSALFCWGMYHFPTSCAIKFSPALVWVLLCLCSQSVCMLYQHLHLHLRSWIYDHDGFTEETIVATSASSIGAALDIKSSLTWISTSYFLTTAVIQPIIGRLSVRSLFLSFLSSMLAKLDWFMV